MFATHELTKSILRHSKYILQKPFNLCQRYFWLCYEDIEA